MSNCCANSASVLSPRTAARATFALKAGVWFRRGRLVIVSPGLQPFWLLSGRNSTYPAVQIFRASSEQPLCRQHHTSQHGSETGGIGNPTPDQGQGKLTPTFRSLFTAKCPGAARYRRQHESRRDEARETHPDSLAIPPVWTHLGDIKS